MSSGLLAGQIGATAAVEEQRVAADQPSVDLEALAAGRVAGRVHQGDVDRADPHDVARVVHRQVIVADARSSAAPTALRLVARGWGNRCVRAASAMPSME